MNLTEISALADARRRSAGVLACEFTRRLAGCSCWRRDAAATRSRDGCATWFMERLQDFQIAHRGHELKRLYEHAGAPRQRRSDIQRWKFDAERPTSNVQRPTRGQGCLRSGSWAGRFEAVLNFRRPPA